MEPQCDNCAKPGPFTEGPGDTLYCEECNKDFLPRCYECDEPLTAWTITFESNYWCEECADKRKEHYVFAQKRGFCEIVSKHSSPTEAAEEMMVRNHFRDATDGWFFTTSELTMALADLDQADGQAQARIDDTCEFCLEDEDACACHEEIPNERKENEI